MNALEKSMTLYANKPLEDKPESLPLAILYFSNINEIIHTLGVTVVNELSQQLANRIRSNRNIIESLYKLGPRSFAIAKENIDLYDFVKDGKEVTSSLKEPFLLNNIPVSMNMHIGISQQNISEIDMESLIQKAGIAANHAMKNNKLYLTYSKNMTISV